MYLADAERPGGVAHLPHTQEAELVVTHRTGVPSALAAGGAEQDDPSTGVGQSCERPSAGDRFIVGVREDRDDGRARADPGVCVSE